MDPFLEALDDDPLITLERWLEEATDAGLFEPDAAALATATREGRPSVRMVLLRRRDARGVCFFTNHESRKGRELAQNPQAAIVVHWGPPLGRQVRLEGTVERLTDAESFAYFASRPRASRIGAWASPQSRPLADRAELERLVAATEERFADDADPPLPPHWGGYRLVPERVELWQSGPSRLHDRAVFTRTPDGWQRTRLAP